MGTLKAISKHGKSEQALYNCISYVLQESKTRQEACCVTGIYNYSEITPVNVVNSFMDEKKNWNKCTGRFYDHYVYSWAPKEKITERQALDFAKELSERMFPDYQALIAVHHDKDHLHTHIIVNSVSYVHGRKLETSAEDLQKFKNIADQMCRVRGLRVVEKGKHYNGVQIQEGNITAWNNAKYRVLMNQTKKSYVAECGAAVLHSLEKRPKSRDEFIYRMNEQGWKTKWGDQRKYITFVNGDGMRVRNSNLSRTFHIDCSKEALEQQFLNNTKEVSHEYKRPEGISPAAIAEAGTTASVLVKQVSCATSQYAEKQRQEDEKQRRYR